MCVWKVTYVEMRDPGGDLRMPPAMMDCGEKPVVVVVDSAKAPPMNRGRDF